MKYSYFVPELLLISSSLAGRIWKINWPHMAQGRSLPIPALAKAIQELKRKHEAFLKKQIISVKTPSSSNKIGTNLFSRCLQLLVPSCPALFMAAQPLPTLAGWICELSELIARAVQEPCHLIEEPRLEVSTA